MKKSYKFRLYPNGQQKQLLISILQRLQELYNAALEQRRHYWRCHRKSISAFDQIKQLPELRRERPEYKEIYAQILQDVLRRVDKAFQLFFRRLKSKNGKAGYPRYKSRDRYDSFTYPQAYNGCFQFKGNKVWLSKIGAIRIRKHREIEGDIKTVTIKREGRHWYIVISCDNVPARPLPPSDKIVGIDVGIKKYATMSDGTVIENPKHLKKSLERLKEAQRVLSRKKKRTSAYRKARETFARIQRKVTNQRRDFLHKLTWRLVNEYGTIVVEKLAIKRLLQLKNGCNKQSKGLHRGITDAAWGLFVAFLRYKAEEAGRRLVEVEPAGTTRTCSECGYVFPDHLPLSQRMFKCPRCHLHISRDLNAAKNILRLGTSLVG